MGGRRVERGKREKMRQHVPPLGSAHDGNGVENAVADGDAAAATRPPVHGEPLPVDQEGRQHRRAPARRRAVPVREGHVQQGRALGRPEEHAEGVAEEACCCHVSLFFLFLAGDGR